MPEVVASAAPTDDAEQDAAKSLPKLPVQRTEFGVDVGGANSVGGLRALWRGLLKSRSNAALTTLRPIIVIKEGSNGLGMQLRLVAGPLDDAAAAAKICAGLTENNRPCATTVFDGQRLVMNADEAAVAERATDKPAAAKPATTRYFVHRRGFPKRVAVEEPAKKPDPPSSDLVVVLPPAEFAVNPSDSNVLGSISHPFWRQRHGRALSRRPFPIIFAK